MKILHVIPTVARSDGGPSEVVLQVVHHLSGLGQTCSILATNRGATPNFDRSTSMVLTAARPPARLNFSPGFSRALTSQLLNIDIMHIHSVDSFPTSIAARAAVRYDIPFVLQPHGAFDSYHRRKNRIVKILYGATVDRKAFHRASAVIVSSMRERRDFLRTYPSLPTVVVPLGVEDRLLNLNSSARERAPGPLRVLFLGRLTEKKSPDIAINAFAKSGLAAQGARLTMAGPLDPRLRYSPVRVAAAAGVSGAVDFTGEVDATRRAKLLSDCDIFILPSKDESFGISVAEAMATGCCVIATSDVGIMPDAAIAQAGVVAQRSVDSFAVVLRRLADAPLERLHLSARATAYAEATFSWPQIAEQLLSLYREAADSFTSVRKGTA